MRLNAFVPRGQVVLAVAALLLVHVPGWADTVHFDNRETLKGLRGVAVIVGMVGPDAEGYGLTQPQLQADIEQRLHQHGIRVTREARGFLVVKVATQRINDDAYAVDILLQLNQPVRLERSLSIPSKVGTTWEADSLLLVGPGFHHGVRSSVANLVDQFINAYLEENPKD